MITTAKTPQVFIEALERNESILKFCNKKIEHLTKPEIYGACLSRCNCIVINKERMMTIKVDETKHTTYEFSPLYPTYFSPETARKIIDNDIYKDCNGNRIELVIVGELAYYNMLKEKIEKEIKVLKMVMN